ncbi:CPBP family glutamic-type intramembrane protease [Caulobacter sp. DWP3-1-3b2]|uniref:CPBP family glutamic-type intramembrane protease n=1 Tax=Caulobacter sp. DWP3-1-3b2 TaxID=2804643 RepID=UPI003CEC1602
MKSAAMTRDRLLQRRVGYSLCAMGVVAVLSLLLAPMELLQPSSLHFGPLTFRGLTLINPLILVLASVGIGSWLAPSVGLRAPLVEALILRHGAVAVLRRQIVPALAAGLATAVILFGYNLISTPWFASTKMPNVPIPLVTKILYGGIVEELMTRWAVMTFLVWAGWRLARRPDPLPPALYLIATLLAALVFAAGHLPLLFVLMPSPSVSLVAAVILGNTLPGFLFGLLFWRRGLEAAVMAHAIAHLFFTLATFG